MVFWACDWDLWKILPISSIWKWDFRLFFGSCNRNLSRKMSISSVWKRYFRGSGLVTVTFGKQCQYLVFENGMSVVFWACDGNLWKILPISSIWKWNFRVFLGFWWEPLENNANIFYLKTGFPFFGLVMGPLENNTNIFYLKRGFPWFFGLVTVTSGKQCQYLLFENGISVVFLGLWR